MQVDPLRVAYVAAFGSAAAGCLVAAVRARQSRDSQVRETLAWLLVIVGAWAVATTGQVAVDGARAKELLYTVGLVLGLASVPAWLAFCSAYAGLDYHRKPWVRRATAATYLAVVALKLTNPLHGAYFRARLVSEPFPHLVVDLFPVHWVVVGVVYVAVGAASVALWQTLRASSQDTRTLEALMVVALLPVGLQVAARLVPGLLVLSYEPLGVAVFAVGALWFARDRFFAARRTVQRRALADLEIGLVYVDPDGRVVDATDAAVAALPALAGAHGRPAASVHPALGTALAGEGQTIGVERDGETRYYGLRSTAADGRAGPTGTAVAVADVTDLERSRRRLQRRERHLDDLAAALAHELRNPLEVIGGHADLAGRELAGPKTDGGSTTGGSPDLDRVRTSLAEIGAAGERMTAVVDDLSLLARQGSTPASTVDCDLRSVVEAAGDRASARENVTAGDDWTVPTVTVAADATVDAERDRLVTALARLFEDAGIRGAAEVTVVPTGDGFRVTDDGRERSGAEAEAAVEHGGATADPKAGIRLATAAMLARAHGWALSVCPDEARVEGATVDRDDRPDAAETAGD
jgi:signal transduction histidine kinase